MGRKKKSKKVSEMQLIETVFLLESLFNWKKFRCDLQVTSENDGESDDLPVAVVSDSSVDPTEMGDVLQYETGLLTCDVSPIFGRFVDNTYCILLCKLIFL